MFINFTIQEVLEAPEERNISTYRKHSAALERNGFLPQQL